MLALHQQAVKSLYMCGVPDNVCVYVCVCVCVCSSCVRRTELFDYQRVIFYAVVTSVVALDRPTLKSKVSVQPSSASCQQAQKPAMEHQLDSMPL